MCICIFILIKFIFIIDLEKFVVVLFENGFCKRYIMESMEFLDYFGSDVSIW